jgi:hypothetical protein
MACRHTPKEIKQDPKLRAEFSPRRLEGLAAPCLYWRRSEEIAADRRLKAWAQSTPTVEVSREVAQQLREVMIIQHRAGHC